MSEQDRFQRIIILGQEDLSTSALVNLLDKSQRRGMLVVRPDRESFGAAIPAKTDIAIMDLACLSDRDMIQAFELVDYICEKCRLLVLVDDERTSMADVLIRTKVYGVIPSQESQAELVQAIDTVARGRRHYPKGFSYRNIFPVVPGKKNPITTLTKRQKEVLGLVGMGKTDSLIAEELGVKIGTVRKHKYEGMDKLGLKKVQEVVTLYTLLNWGWSGNGFALR